MKTVSLVVPIFNEEGSIDIFLERTKRVMEGCDDVDYELIFVNDGSTDKSLERLLDHAKHDKKLRIIDLSRNFGKEAALTAGIDSAQGDAVIPIDVDLQDPPELIPRMLEKWKEGYEVVLCRRKSRSHDSLPKKISAGLFYKIHNLLSATKIPENVGDFRLMDRTVVEALKRLPESRRFMKGLFAWAGFHTTYIDYDRPERSSGKTKFNGWKLWNFALEGITSFSTVPLRIWTYVGLITSLLAFIYAMILVIRVIFYGIDLPGYASLMVSIMFLGGIQLIGIGVLGEYIGRIYIESKRRPVYIARREYNSQQIKNNQNHEK